MAVVGVGCLPFKDAQVQLIEKYAYMYSKVNICPLEGCIIGL